MRNILALIRNGKPWTALWFNPLFATKKSASEGLGRNPTDRGRTGSKLHLHVDGKGIPFGFVVVGANVHDSRLVSQTLNASIEFGTYCIDSEARNLCLDKGYDYERVHIEVFVCGFEGHIRGRGEEACAIKEGHTPKRWVVERTIAWFKAFRSIRTRYCKYLRSFCAFVALAASCILLRKFMLIK